MAVGPAGKFGHAFEPGLLVHRGRLEVVALHPDAAHAAPPRLVDEGIEQDARMATPAMRLVDPHLLEFGGARPAVTGGDGDHLPGFVAHDEAETLRVVLPGRAAVVAIEVVLDGVDLVGGKIVALLDGKPLHRQIEPHGAATIARQAVRYLRAQRFGEALG